MKRFDWTVGDDSGSETLTGADKLNEAHVNELREALDSSVQEYNVQDFGATGDGVTDDTSAIQDAIDAIDSNGGGVLYFPEGTYIVSVHEEYPTPQINLCSNLVMRGIKGLSWIDFSDVGGHFYAFAGEGSIGSAISLTSNASKGDDTLSLDTSSLSADDYLLIYSDTVRTPRPQYAGEIKRIASIDDGSTLTLDHQLDDDYVTSDSAAVKKITLIENVTIRDLSFRGTEAVEWIDNAFWFRYGKNINLRDCHFEHMGGRAVYADSTIDSSVIGCEIHDSEGTGYGYGIMLSEASQDWVINDNVADNVKNFVAIGGHNNDYGIVRRINASGNNVTSWGSGFDSHDNAEDLNYSNNVIKGYRGFNLRCGNINISNNIVRCFYAGMIYQPQINLTSQAIIANNIFEGYENEGIYIIQSTTDYGDIDGLIITGNTLEGLGTSRDIEIVGSNNYSPIKGMVLSNNDMENSAGGGGIRLYETENASLIGNVLRTSNNDSAAIWFSDTIDKATVSSNVIIHSGTGTTRGLRFDDSSTDNVIMGNVVDGASVGILLGNSCTYNNVVGNNVRGCTTGITLGSGTGNVQADNIT